MTKLNSMVPFRTAVVGLVLLAGVVSALSQEYCSSENTGSDYDVFYSIYQSNGACYDQCKSNYAFAIVQYQDCWCSNYAPADQQDTGNCDQNCPGYPRDKCGNADTGLYGYIALNVQPSGTAGGSTNTQASSTSVESSATELVSTSLVSYPTSNMEASSSDPPTSTSTFSLSPSTVAIVSIVTSTSVALVIASSTLTPSPTPRTTWLTSYFSQSSTSATQEQSSSTSTSDAQTSYVSQTVYQTVTPSTVVSYVTPTSSSSTSYSTTTSSTTTPVVAPVSATTEVSSNTPSSSETPTPVTSVRIVTVSGAIVTQTVTSTPSPTAANGSDDTTPLHRKGLSGGAIAGVVIGCLLGVAALILGACLLWRRKRQDDDAEEAPARTGRGPNNPRRTTSVLSRTGLLARGRPTSMGEKDFDEPLYVNTGTGHNSVRHSMLLGAGAVGGEGVSPVSPLDSSQDTDSNRRHSKPLVYDQRLNPSALFANAEANGSRVSMQDQQDYSRPLGIANPDVRASFESRVSHA